MFLGWHLAVLDAILLENTVYILNQWPFNGDGHAWQVTIHGSKKKSGEEMAFVPITPSDTLRELGANACSLNILNFLPVEKPV